MSYNSLSVQSNSRQNAIRSNLDSVNLPADSKSWLIQNLDPFHDGQFTMCAPPTPSQLDSVVQLRRARFTISVPASQHAGNEGNISIFVPPVPTPTKFYFQEDTGNLVPGSRFPVEYGGIMVNDYAATSLGYTTAGRFDAPPDAAWRVVGFGYELTNTTP